MKKHLSNIILGAVFFVGLLILLYPTLSNYINSKHQSGAIATFTQALEGYTPEDYSAVWEAAERYNQQLAQTGEHLNLTEEEEAEYNRLLNPTENGMMGYIEIDTIGVNLPLYHGISDTVLQVGAGHLPGTSLPTGGMGTHTVLSGHRGLPSSKLFTDLDRLEEGDIFLLHVLDRVLAYEVDQIKIVLPEITEDLRIDRQEDYCTLITCTPYGINTHRMLVRGKRVDYEEARNTIVPADAIQLDPVAVAPVAAIPMLLVMLLVLLASPKKKKSKKAAGQLPERKDGESSNES